MMIGIAFVSNIHMKICTTYTQPNIHRYTGRDGIFTSSDRSEFKASLLDYVFYWNFQNKYASGAAALWERNQNQCLS